MPIDITPHYPWHNDLLLGDVYISEQERLDWPSDTLKIEPVIIVSFIKSQSSHQRFVGETVDG